MARHDDLERRAADAARAAVLPDVLRTEDVAVAMRLAPATVLRLLRERVIPGRKIGGRWFVEREVFLDAIRPAFGSCIDCTRVVALLDADETPMCRACAAALERARAAAS